MGIADLVVNKYYNNERLFTKGFVMGISSLGVGSGILTQDVLDQLRKADEAQRIEPISLDLANENDKKESMGTLDATMTNLRDAVNELKNISSFNSRSTTVTGSSVSVKAAENSDIQDFNIHVDTLATKQIEQSGAFSASSDSISTADGTFKLEVGSQSVTIDYTAGTTLDEMKKLIQDQAGDLVDASVLKISDTDSRLILSAKSTGVAQDIKISDVSGTLDSKLTTNSSFDASGNGDAPIQAGKDSSFTFNGQNITRSSNEVSDLVTGYTINLLQEDATDESSDVSVMQDRTELMSRVDSFVEKYNAAITELGDLTLSSTDSSTRGIFSGDSTVKSMKSALENMLTSISGDAGRMVDYGFELDRDGVLSIDKTNLESKLDDNTDNVKAFFTGGDYTKADSSVASVTGAFSTFYDIVNGYTKTNGGLDLLQDNISQNISNLEDRKTSATERLDAKYEIMKKQYTAYNSLINSFNASSDIFTQLSNSNNSN